MTLINNLCSNPSFENDLTGWAAQTDTSIAQDNTYALYGSEAMLVTTDGLVVGEGFTGPVATNGGSPTTGAIGLDFLSTGTGTLTFEAVDASTGTVLGTTTVTLDGSSAWDQRVTVTFSLTASQTYHLVVSTTSVQALNFWVDGCQYETGVTTASPYIDGDQPGCQWTGTPGDSTSQQLYLNATSASGIMTLSGRASPVTVGLAVSTSASGKMKLTGDLKPGTANVPLGAFADFAIFGLTDPDPAMTYADLNNAGRTTGHTTYGNSWGIFYPPLDYPVSNGNFAWRRAAYMGIGFYLTGIPTSIEQNLTQVQVALAPVGTSAPPAYTPPRQLVPIIKPTRLNFCTNPSFEVSAAGWSGVGTGTVAQDSTVVPPPEYDTMFTVGNLGSFFNSVAISNDGSTGAGNFDGGNFSFSAQQLALAGLGIGAQVVAGGIDYQMPTVPAGQADCVAANGQTIPISGPTGAAFIAFLGSASNGGSGGVSATVTINYTDGTTGTASLGFSDWTLNAGAASPAFGNQIAASLPYRNHNDGTEDTTVTYVYSATIAANSAKQIASITLPSETRIHIFGISLAQVEGNTFGSNSGKVTVNASGDGVKMSVADLIVGDTYTVSLQTEAGPGLSALTVAVGGKTTVVSGSGNLATGVWHQPSATFVATSSTAQLLQITATAGAGFSSPSSFWVDAVLIEEGEIINPYFDASFSGADVADYQWESTAGLSRSYYYQQLAVKKFSIQEILAQHIPLGISAASPQYAVPYTQ